MDYNTLGGKEELRNPSDTKNKRTKTNEQKNQGGTLKANLSGKLQVINTEGRKEIENHPFMDTN